MLGRKVWFRDTNQHGFVDIVVLHVGDGRYEPATPRVWIHTNDCSPSGSSPIGLPGIHSHDLPDDSRWWICVNMSGVTNHWGFVHSTPRGYPLFPGLRYRTTPACPVPWDDGMHAGMLASLELPRNYENIVRINGSQEEYRIRDMDRPILDVRGPLFRFAMGLNRNPPILADEARSVQSGYEPYRDDEGYIPNVNRKNFFMTY